MAVGADPLQGGRDGGVIGGRGRKGLLRQAPLGGRGERSARRGHLFRQRVVISGRGDDRNILEILGCRADHRGPANIDVFDQVFKRHTRLGRGFLKSVKIDHHHVDWLNAMFGDGAAVRGHLSPVQDAPVHLGMQRLDPPVEHLGKTGQLGNVLHADPGFAQQLGSAPGRNKFHTHAGKFAGKLHQPRLVGHAEDGTLYLRLGRGHGSPRMKWECAWRRQEEILTAVVGPWSLVVGLRRKFSGCPRPWGDSELSGGSMARGRAGRANDQRPRANDYVFALALSFTWPLCISTVYSTSSQPYCLRICSVFF